MTASALSDAQMQWYLADPRISEEHAPLLASAFSAESTEEQRKYATTRLSATQEGVKALEAITAAFSGDGNSYINRRARAMRQLRNRLGQFAYQGGGARVAVRTKDGSTRWLTGTVVGATAGSNTYDIETSKGVVRVPASSVENVEAYLPGKTKDGYSPVPARLSAADESDIINEADLEFVDSPPDWVPVDNFQGKPGEKAFSDGVYTVAQTDNEDGSKSYRLIDENGDEVAKGDSWASMLDESAKDALGGAEPSLEITEDMLLEGLDEIANNETAGAMRSVAQNIAAFLRNGTEPTDRSPKQLAEQAEKIADVLANDADAKPNQVTFGKKFQGFEDDFRKGAEAINKKLQGQQVSEDRKEEKQQPIAELPKETAPALEVPQGAYALEQGDYKPSGRVLEDSTDFTDDPETLATKFKPADIAKALNEALIGENPDRINGVGYGGLEFNEGIEEVPAEALYFALKKQGKNADKFVADTYEKGKARLDRAQKPEAEVEAPPVPETPEAEPVAEIRGEDVADALDRVKDIPEVSEVTPAKGEQPIEDVNTAEEEAQEEDPNHPALIEGLTEDEQQAWVDSGFDHVPFLPSNEEITFPESYSQIDSAPFSLDEITTVEEGDELNQSGIPVGWTDDPYVLAQDYSTQDLIDSLEYSLESRDEDSENDAGYAPFSVTNEDGDDVGVQIESRAIRDALQLQGEDTNEILQEIADRAWAAQAENTPIASDVEDGRSSGDLTDEEMQAMLDGEGIAEEPSVSQIIAERARGIEPGGGLTIDPLDGSEPTEGFVVARQGFNKEINYDEFMSDPEGYVYDYLASNREALSEDGMYLGFWRDEENNEMVLDVSEVFSDREAGIQAGIDRNQQAIYDIGSNEVIDTGGTGDRKETAENQPSEAAEETQPDDGRGTEGIRKRSRSGVEEEVQRPVSSAPSTPGQVEGDVSPDGDFQWTRISPQGDFEWVRTPRIAKQQPEPEVDASGPGAPPSSSKKGDGPTLPPGVRERFIEKLYDAAYKGKKTPERSLLSPEELEVLDTFNRFDSGFKQRYANATIGGPEHPSTRQNHFDYNNLDGEDSSLRVVVSPADILENKKEALKREYKKDSPTPTTNEYTEKLPVRELSDLLQDSPLGSKVAPLDGDFSDIDDAKAAEDNLIVTPRTPRSLDIGKRPARTLQPGDVTVGDNFTIVEVGTDRNEDDQIVIKGYFPGHPVQEKLWRHYAKINVVRGLGVDKLPKAGDLPEIHKPKEEEFADQGGIEGDAYKLAYAKWRGALNAALALWTDAPAGAKHQFNPDTDPHIIAVHGEFVRPGDILADRGNFVVQRVFTDEKTKNGFVSVEGYYPGHESQRKEWKKRQPNGPMEVIRNAELPEQGPLPEFHQPHIINARGNWQPDNNDVEGQKAYKKAIADAAARYDMPKDLPLVEFNEQTAGLPSVPQDDNPYVPEMPKYPPFVPTDAFAQGEAAELLRAANGDWNAFAESLKGKELIFFDYETTGLMRDDTNNPVQIGAVKVVDGQVVDRFNVYMNPERNLEGWSLENLKDGEGNPLTDEYLQQQISMKDAHEQFIEWAGENKILVAHNSAFDREILGRVTSREGISYDPAGYMDVLAMAMAIHKDDANKPSNNKLPTLAEHYGVALGDGWHTADADSEATAGVFQNLLNNAIDNGYGKSLFDVDANIEKNAKAMENYDNNLLPEYKRKVAEALAYQAVQDAMNGKKVNVDDLVNSVNEIKAMNDPAAINVASDAKPLDVSVLRNSVFPDGRMRVASMEWALDDANARDTDYKELQVKDLQPGDFMYNKAGDKLFQVISVTDQNRDDRKAVIRRIDLQDGTAHDFPQHWGVRLDKIRRPINRDSLANGEKGDATLNDVIKIDDASVTNARTCIVHNDLPNSTLTAESFIQPDDSGNLIGECLVSDDEGDVIATQTNTGSSIDELTAKGQEFYGLTVSELRKLIQEAKKALGIDQKPKELSVPDALKNFMPPVKEQEEVFTDADGNPYFLSIIKHTDPITGNVYYESAIVSQTPDGSDWNWENAKITTSDNITDLVTSLNKFKKDNGPKESIKPSKKPVKSKEQKTRESRNIPKDAFLREEVLDDGSVYRFWETPAGKNYPFDVNDPEQAKRSGVGQVFGDPDTRILSSDTELNDAASLIYIDPSQLDAINIENGEIKVRQAGQKVNDGIILPGGQVDVETVEHPDGHTLEIEIDRAPNYEGEPDIYRVIVRRHDGEDKIEVLADHFSDTNDALSRYKQLVDMAKNGNLAVKSSDPATLIDPNNIIVTDTDADIKQLIGGGGAEYLRVIGDGSKEYQIWSNENFIYASGAHQARLGDRVEVFWDDLRDSGEGVIVDWEVIHNRNDKSRIGYAVVAFRDGSHGIFSTDMLILKGRGKGFEGRADYSPPVAAPRPELSKERIRQYALRNRYTLARRVRDANNRKVKDENGNTVIFNVLMPYVADAPKNRTFRDDVILTAKALKLQRERGNRIRVYHEESGLDPEIPFEMRPPGGDNREARIWQAAVDLLDGKPFKDEVKSSNEVRPAAPAAPATTPSGLTSIEGDNSGNYSSSDFDEDPGWTEGPSGVATREIGRGSSEIVDYAPGAGWFAVVREADGGPKVLGYFQNRKEAIDAAKQNRGDSSTPEAPEAQTPEQARNKYFRDYVTELTEVEDYEDDYQFRGYTADGEKLYIYDKKNSNEVRIAWDESGQGWQVDFPKVLFGNDGIFADLEEAGEHALSILDEFRRDNPNYGEAATSSTDNVIPPEPTDESSQDSTQNPAGPNFNLGPAPDAPVVEDTDVVTPDWDEVLYNGKQAIKLYTDTADLYDNYARDFASEAKDVESVTKFLHNLSAFNRFASNYYDDEKYSDLDKALKTAEGLLVWLDNDPGLYAVSDNFNADLEKLTVELRNYLGRTEPSDTINIDEVTLTYKLLDAVFVVGIGSEVESVVNAFNLLNNMPNKESKSTNKKINKLLDDIQNKNMLDPLDDEKKRTLNQLIDKFKEANPVPEDPISEVAESPLVQQRILDNVNAVTIPQILADRINNLDPEIRDEISKFMEGGSPKALANLSKKARNALNTYTEFEIENLITSAGREDSQELIGFYLALKQERLGQNPNPTSLGDGDFLRGVSPVDIENASRIPGNKLIVNGNYTGYTVSKSAQGGGFTGANETYLIKNEETGETFIFKYEDDKKSAYKEALAINVLNAFGIEGISYVAPHQDNPNFIIMTFAGANMNLDDVAMGESYDEEQYEIGRVDVLQSLLIGLFDAGALNSDRHSQNFLVGLDEFGNHISLPIDHGLTLQYDGGLNAFYRPEDYFEEVPNELASPLIQEIYSNWGPVTLDELLKMSTQQAIQALKRMYPPGQVPDIDTLIERLERLKSRGITSQI